MMRVLRGYLRTLRQYAASPKTRYEYKHYAIFLLLYILAVAIIWGGMYIYNGNH